MKSIFWVLGGIGLGVVAAVLFSRTETGKEFFESVDAKARQLKDAVAEGYNERIEELRNGN